MDRDNNNNSYTDPSCPKFGLLRRLSSDCGGGPRAEDTVGGTDEDNEFLDIQAALREAGIEVTVAEEDEEGLRDDDDTLLGRWPIMPCHVAD